jgi:hypothetical protein
MIYQQGDVVALRGVSSAPTACRVLKVMPVETGDQLQLLLELEPLGAPWSAGTTLLRFDSTVTPVAARQTLRGQHTALRPAIVAPGSRRRRPTEVRHAHRL